jgi:hypothetical protein
MQLLAQKIKIVFSAVLWFRIRLDWRHWPADPDPNPDPDLYPFQPHVKLKRKFKVNCTFSRNFQYATQNSESYDTCGQCCGSGSESGSTGSTCFWASWIRIRIHRSEVWIRILLLSCKNSKKNLNSYYFVTLLTFYL